MEFDPTAFEQFDLCRDDEANGGGGGGIDEGGDGDVAAERELLESKGGAKQSLSAPKQAVLLVIHVTPDMFESRTRTLQRRHEEQSQHTADSSRTSETTLWQEILKSLASFFKSRIVAAYNDKLGVLLYGTAEAKNDLNLPGIYTLFDLNFPDAHRIRQLEDYATRIGTLSEFNRSFGPLVEADEAEDAQISPSDLFWVTNQMFVSKSNLRQFQNRIIIFTSCDDPCGGRPEIRNASIQRAKDLQQDLAAVELIPLEVPGRIFDMSKFYADVLMVSEEDFDTYREASEVKLEDIRTRIRAKEHPQRVLGRIPFEVCEGVEMAVGIFTSALQAKVPTPFSLNANDNGLLKSETKYICEETGALLGPDQIRKYIAYGGEKVYISAAQKAEAMNFPGVGVGLKCLGFKPISRIKPQHNIRHPYFVYPLDSPPYGTEGSSQLCQALLIRMSERKQVAIVRWIARMNAAVRFGALLPQLEEVNESGEQVVPAGFHLVPLPFAEDIRRLNLSESQPPVASDVSDADAVGAVSDQKELHDVKLATDVVRGLVFADEFVPHEEIQNTVLQKHYYGIEALALGESEPPVVEDSLQPDVETMTAILKPSVDAFRDAVYGEGSAASSPPKAKAKAKAQPKAKAAPKKRAVTSESLDQDAIQAAIANSELNKLTVVQLKTILSSKGLPVTGRKAELIARIEKSVDVGKKRRRRSATSDADDQD